MSSATILFVLQQIMSTPPVPQAPGGVFGAAFGPGLTMETFLLTAPGH
jgi:predicted naringenin-chalcone synthase